MGNKLNHRKKLASLVTEIKYSLSDRRYNRFGRNGETSSSTSHKELVKRYNKMTRYESKRQLKHYTS